MDQWVERLGMGSIGALVSWWFIVFFAMIASMPNGGVHVRAKFLTFDRREPPT